MAEVKITSVAEQDFTESFCWYFERDVQAATDFEREFQRVISELQFDPERFPFCDEPYRYMLMQRFPFRVIFRHDDDAVIVMAVAHASRSPDYWQQR